MPFEIIRNDITHMQVDAIVNTANPRPVIGSGVDAAVHAKAGPMLLAARKLIGVMNTGEARATPGFRLPCKHVIHTVGPVWEDGGHGEAWLLPGVAGRTGGTVLSGVAGCGFLPDNAGRSSLFLAPAGTGRISDAA